MFEYKTVKKAVPWCDKCDTEITGNGSSVLPYECDCGIWRYDREVDDYVLKK